MAEIVDKSVGDLPVAAAMDDDSLIPGQQQGDSVAYTGKLLKDYAVAAASGYATAASGFADAAGAAAGAATEQKNQAAAAARAAANQAEAAAEARQAIENMVVEAVSLATGAPASVSKELVDGVVKLIFGIPRGGRGPAGAYPDITEAVKGMVLTAGESGLPEWAEASGGVNVTTCTLPKGRMKGDVDGDGQITMADSDALVSHRAGNEIITDEIALWCCDVTGDGQVNATDASQILKFIKGEASTLTGGTNPKMADYYGNWTYVKVDNLNGYFYTDIAVEGITAQTDVVAVVRGEFTDGNYTEIIPQDGGLRVCAKRIPIAEVSMIVNYWEGNGTGVILQERSVPDVAIPVSVSLISSVSGSDKVFDITVDDSGVPSTTNTKDKSVVKLQKAVTGTAGQFVVIGADGNPTTMTLTNVAEEGA